MADGTTITAEQIKALWEGTLGEEPSGAELHLFARALKYFGGQNQLMILAMYLIHLTHRDARSIEFEILEKGPSALQQAREMIDEFNEVLRLLKRTRAAVAELTVAYEGVVFVLQEHEMRKKQSEEKQAKQREERWRQVLSGRHPMTLVITGMVGVIFASFFGSLLAIYALGATPNVFGAEPAPAARSATELQQMQSWRSEPSRGLTPTEQAAEDAEYGRNR
jgi:hypothetical protein